MAPRPEGSQPVSAEGTLHLETPGGQSLQLVADGENVRLDMPRWVDARVMFPRSLRGRRRAMRVAAKLFATYGLTLSVESAGKSVLRLGHNTAPSMLARLLGLAPAYIPVSALRVLLRR